MGISCLLMLSEVTRLSSHHHAGLYLVTVTAYNLVSNLTITRNVSVQENISDVRVNHTLLIKTNQTINVTVLPHVGTDVRYQLLPGDGRTINSTERVFPLHYSQAGSYQVVLNTGNDVSAVVTQCGVIVVQDVISGLSVVTRNFSVALSQEAEIKWRVLQGSSMSITVDFGDGHSYQNATVSVADLFVAISRHRYQSPGEYLVNISLANGVSFVHDSATVYVETPLGGLLMSIHRSENNASRILGIGLCADLYVKAGENISVAVNVVNGTNVRLQFDLGGLHNQNASYEREFPGPVVMSRPFPQEGEYDITVTASNLNGAVNASCRIIVQYPVENVSIESNSPQAIPDGNVTFTVLTPGVNQPTRPTYVYYFGDGSLARNSSSDVSSHKYSHDGMYTVVVNVSNEISAMSSNTTVVLQDAVVELNCSAFHTHDQPRTPGVFPVEHDVFFNCSIRYGTNVTYIFDYSSEGNISNREGESRHRFSSPGEVTVNITARNLVSEKSEEIPITIDDSVKISEFSNDGPSIKGSMTTFTLRLDKRGKDASFKVEYSANKTEQLEFDGMYKNFNHTFKEVGEYQVKVTAKNRVSSVELPVPVSIVKQPCSYPEMDFVNVGHNETTRTQFTRSQFISIETVIKIDCQASETKELQWQVIKENAEGISGPALSKSGRESNLRILHVPARKLDYGKYKVSLNISMVNVPGVSTKKDAYIEIIPSALIAVISGGAERPVGFSKTLVLDASESKDPDMSGSDEQSYTVSNDSDIRLFWFCKRSDNSNYTLPEEVNPDNPPSVVAPSACNTSNCSSVDHGGCFGSGPGRINSSARDAVHSIDTSKLTEDETYTFRLLVTKENRTTVFVDQQVKVMQGDPPGVSIRWVYCVERQIH